MTHCTHTWTPVPLEIGRYACPRCGCIGRRTTSGIRPLKRPQDDLRRAIANAEWSSARDAAAREIQRGRYGVDYAGSAEE